MSLEINEGTLILKFHSPNEGLDPNILHLQDDVPSIEDYLDKMLILIKRLEEIVGVEGGA